MQGIRLRLALEYLDKLDRKLAALDAAAERKTAADAPDAVTNARVRAGWSAGWNACLRELRRAVRDA